jgi:uncharacterized protein (TIGR02996 family)
MTDEDAFQAAICARPDDDHLRLVYADWLQERGDPRGELIRLLHTLTQAVEVPERDRLEDRLRGLVAAGVQAVGPFFTNSIGMKFAWIPAGVFLMGSPPEEVGREDDETQHAVTLTRGFYLGIHAVTQAAWRAVMNSEPSRFVGDELPVDSVSWDDCQEFLRRLSARGSRAYRLPTEAEWEYACRAGTTTPFHFGMSCNGKQVNCDGGIPYGTSRPGPYLGKTSLVGAYAANAFGLFDLHGNVIEWCGDRYGTYPQEAAINPQGPDSGDFRVWRGGSWNDPPALCRSAYRSGCDAEFPESHSGARVALCLD